MDTVFQIIVMGLLAMVFIQDLKLRAIHVLLPIFILVFGVILHIRNGYEPINMMYSAVFLCITFGGLYVYLSIKNKKFTNPFKKNMGLGDVLFFIAVIPFFNTYNYILFFTTGMVFSIVGFIVIKVFAKTDLVPLAGLLALYFLILKLSSYISGYDVFINKIV